MRNDKLKAALVAALNGLNARDALAHADPIQTHDESGEWVEEPSAEDPALDAVEFGQSLAIEPEPEVARAGSRLAQTRANLAASAARQSVATDGNRYAVSTKHHKRVGHVLADIALEGYGRSKGINNFGGILPPNYQTLDALTREGSTFEIKAALRLLFAACRDWQQAGDAAARDGVPPWSDAAGTAELVVAALYSALAAAAKREAAEVSAARAIERPRIGQALREDRETQSACPDVYVQGKPTSAPTAAEWWRLLESTAKTRPVADHREDREELGF